MRKCPETRLSVSRAEGASYRLRTHRLGGTDSPLVDEDLERVVLRCVADDVVGRNVSLCLPISLVNPISTWQGAKRFFSSADRPG